MKTGSATDATVPVSQPTAANEIATGEADTGPASAGSPPPIQTPQEICAACGSAFVPPAPLDRAAVALASLDQWPLNAQRVTPENGNCGWYIWGGTGRSADAGFFQQLHVANLLTRCPQVTPFLALAPGWRVRISPDGHDIIAPHASAPGGASVRTSAARARARRGPMQQWVWFSILLHVLAFVLFGDTTGEGAQNGARSNGPLNVLLAGVRIGNPDALPSLRTDTTLREPARRSAPPPRRMAPASPTETATAPEAKAAEVPPPVDVPQAVATQPVPESAAPAAVMPPVIAAEVVTPVTTFVVPLAIPELAPPPEPTAAKVPAPLPRMETFAAPQAVTPPKAPREVVLPTQLIPPLAPAPVRAEREAAVALEPVPRLKTFTPPVPTPQKNETEIIASPVEIPRIAPLPVPAERTPSRAAELLPRLTPVAPPPVIEAAKPAEIAPRFVAPTPVPAPVESAVIPPVAQPGNPATPPQAQAAPQAPAQSQDARITEPARAAPVSPALNNSSATPVAPATIPQATRVLPGPAAGSGTTNEIASPRASPITPFLAPAPSSNTPAPRINLDSVRQRAREIDREGSAGPRTLLPLNIKGKEDTRTKEQQAFDKALKRPDCRDAYSGLGLAAVVPLILDTVSEKGCKW
ncbi:MAG: hypothetical protein ABI905_04590 [Betaproteobacteria bacterium]